MKKNTLIGLGLGMLCATTFAFTEEVSAADMHRLYNPNSGEHFYTANGGEKNNLTKVGWRYEGIGWTAPNSGTAVYRLYNKNAGDHHYTLNLAEKNHLVKVGWKYEGIGWYSDTKKAIPLYRAYNPNAKAGSHNYTTNYAEQKNLLKVGWRNEGIAWYGVSKTASTPKPAVQKYTVVVKHVGSDSKVLKTSNVNIEKGKSFTAKAENFNGYTLKGNNQQTVTVNGNKTITFNYTKNAVPIQKFKVTVNHQGNDGKLLKTATLEVEKGKQCTVKAETFTGYTLTSSSQQTITVNNNVTLTFNYKKNEANKTALQQAIAKASEISQGSYTDSSWNNLQTAFSNAKAVYRNTDATQKEVDTAFTNLNNAITNLKENSGQTANKTALQQAIIKASAITKGSILNKVGTICRQF